MTESRISLSCLVDGLPSARAFPIKVTLADTVGDLKDLIKTNQTPAFDDITPDQLTLWRVSIPDDDDSDLPVLLDSVPEKKKLKATTRLLKVFNTELPDDTIHIIVQRPPQ
ncbi:hypothetical protein BGZ88_003110, partial [Linnemannia elongata]